MHDVMRRIAHGVPLHIVSLSRVNIGEPFPDPVSGYGRTNSPGMILPFQRGCRPARVRRTHGRAPAARDRELPEPLGGA